MRYIWDKEVGKDESSSGLVIQVDFTTRKHNS